MTGLLVVLALTTNPFLDEARLHAKNLEFERCLDRLKQATQWKSTPDELRDIELWAGLCHFNLGHRDDARAHFRMALRIDEGTDLPPYTSPKAVELFLSVKKSLQAPVEPMPDTDLPDDAPVKRELTPRDADAPTTVNQPGFDWSRRALPLTLTGVTVVTTVVAIILGLNARALAARANQATFESDFEALAATSRGMATGTNVAWGLTGASAVASIVTWLLVERVVDPVSPDTRR